MFIEQSIYLPILFSHAHCLYLHIYRTFRRIPNAPAASPASLQVTPSLCLLFLIYFGHRRPRCTGVREISIPCTRSRDRPFFSASFNDTANSSPPKGVPSLLLFFVKKCGYACNQTGTGNYSVHSYSVLDSTRDIVERTT